MEQIQFSKEELERYSRHLIIPEFNIEGQRKLKGSSVLVIGSGGLGSPLLLYLAAAGVGRIGIVDFDTVDASNLQRQVLFGIQSVGAPKAEAARDRLASLNPHITLEVHNTKFTSANARELVRQYRRRGGRDGQLPHPLPRERRMRARRQSQRVRQHLPLRRTGFGLQRAPARRNTWAQLPRPVSLSSPPGLVPSCAEGGVIGVLPGILGRFKRWR